MRRDPQQRVALGDGFVDEAELAVLEIPDAAVDHVGRRRRGAADEVAALDERDIDALQREVAEGRETVDPAADDQDIGIRARRAALRTPVAADPT